MPSSTHAIVVLRAPTSTTQADESPAPKVAPNDSCGVIKDVSAPDRSWSRYERGGSCTDLLHADLLEAKSAFPALAQKHPTHLLHIPSRYMIWDDEHDRVRLGENEG
jgi:hypothetical protein